MLLTEAFAALASGTGICGQVLQAPAEITDDADADAVPADAVVELSIDGRSRRYLAICKANVDREGTLAVVKHRVDALHDPALLVTPHLSTQMAARCRGLNLQFVDTAGNAYLNDKGLHVFVSGQRRPEHAVSLVPRSTSSPAAMRMVFAVLTRPALLQASYREIADAANIALGSVGPIFRELMARGMLQQSGRSGQRRLAAPGVLVDEWVAAYPAVLRPKLHAQRFQAPRADWWEQADFDQTGVCWSGEVAAFRMHGYLQPATQMLYVAPAVMPRTLRSLVSTHRLRPDPSGSVEIVEAFWNLGDAGPTVPPLLVYADLMATLDPRNREAAKEIRDREIQLVLDQF